MRRFLEKVRKPHKSYTMATKSLITLGIILASFLLGILQKWIDGSASNVLPDLLNQLDISNFFGRLAIWILLATIISVYAETPLWAGTHTFLFFISMLAGYYLYCNYILGFLPVTYMMIWVTISILSFFFAYICWYAKGQGIIAIFISSGILGVLLAQGIVVTRGIYVRYYLEVITWIIGVLILYRKPKEFALEIGLSLVVAFVYQLLMPSWG